MPDEMSMEEKLRGVFELLGVAHERIEQLVKLYHECAAVKGIRLMHSEIHIILAAMLIDCGRRIDKLECQK